MFQRLVQWHRRARVANAIKAGNLTALRAVLDQGVDLTGFSAFVEEETYEIQTHTREVTSVLDWAVQHNLAADGFEMLLDAGVPLNEAACQRISEQANNPGRFPQAQRIHAAIERHRISLGTLSPSGGEPKKPRL